MTDEPSHKETDAAFKKMKGISRRAELRRLVKHAERYQAAMLKCQYSERNMYNRMREAETENALLKDHIRRVVAELEDLKKKKMRFWK